jgi:hypothetical protein
MNIISLVLLVFAFVCFVLAAWQITAPHHGRLIAAGLAFWAGSELAKSLPK